MQHKLLDKLTSLFMTGDSYDDPSDAAFVPEEKTPYLTLHVPVELQMFVSSPRTYEDALPCADYLKKNHAVVLNLEHVDMIQQQAISDYLNGVCYAVDGSVQRASDFVLLYVPFGVEINKELYAYTVPTYGKE